MRLIALILVALHCLTLGASDVRFPMRGVTVVPESAPVTIAEVVDTLRPEEWYLVESERELICIASPVGVVAIEPLAGPMVFRGRFAGGDGKVETRKFAGPYLYAVTAEVAGKTELIVVPVGVSSADQIERIVITVQGARPPPDVDPEPEPDDPTPPGPVTSFRVIWIIESGDTLNAQQTAIPGAKAIRDYLNAKTTGTPDGQPGWREFDPQQITNNEPAVIQELWKAIKEKQWSAPCVAIEVNNQVKVLPLPANTAEALTLLKRYGGE